MKISTFRFVLIAFFALLAGNTVHAQLMGTSFPHRDPTLGDFFGRGKDWLDYPTVDMDANFAFENDYTAPRGGPSNNALTTTSELFSALNFAPRLGILTHLTYAPVGSPPPGENIWFKDQGLFMEEVFLQYTNDLLTLQFGKFDSDFGVAPSLAPGLYGNSIASEYQPGELLGVRAAYQLGREIYGSHYLSASLFKTDDTFLSESIFTNRGRTTSSMGGPANTSGLESFTLAYTASDVPLFGKPILNYQLAYLNMAPGEDGNAHEQGYAASIWMPIPVEGSTIATIKGRYTSINPLVEYVHLENDGGISGQKADYITAGVDYIRGDYDLAITGTWHRETVSGSPDMNDYMAQISVGKQLFGPNGNISIGYQYARLGGQPVNTVGIAFTWSPRVLERFQVTRGY